MAERLLLDAHDLLDSRLAPRAGFTVESFAMTATERLVQPTDPSNDTVGGELIGARVDEQAVLDEVGALVEEERDALAAEELPVLRILSVVLLRPTLANPLYVSFESFLVERHERIV